MFKHLRDFSNAIEEIEDHIYDVTDEIMSASGGEGMTMKRNGYGAKNQPWDVLLFILGRESHIGKQLNNIFMMLSFLKKDVAFTVRHNHLHGQKGLPEFQPVVR